MMLNHIMGQSPGPTIPVVSPTRAVQTNKSQGLCERLIRLPEVMSLTGLKRSSLYLKMSRSEFPKPVKIGERAAAWKLSEIQGYIDSRPLKGSV